VYQRYHGGKKTNTIRDRIVRERDDTNNTYKQDEYTHRRYCTGEYDENRRATNKHTGNVSPKEDETTTTERNPIRKVIMDNTVHSLYVGEVRVNPHTPHNRSFTDYPLLVYSKGEL
jgi:hypothetical protein